MRRLQEYERYKQSATDLDMIPRLEREIHQSSAEMTERTVVTRLPDLTLKELLLAFKDVLTRAEMLAHHHITREPLSVRQRMSEVLLRVQGTSFVDFAALFDPEEGRMGVTVTFLALLELLKEALIEVVQTEAYAPIHVRAASAKAVLADGQAGSDTELAELQG